MKSKGRYDILEILGEGGMGIVYRAFDPVTNREVTVKTIRDPQDKAALELFRRECAVLASMTHPNIVEIFDIGETEEDGAKRPYFVMPLLPGITVQELIRTASPRLTVERVVEMITQVCRGLWAAHEHGLVHRDLKPSNLFILSDDSVKIIDFGMAHLTNHHSATGMKGTVPYMAPEQLQMKQQPTPLSDQFSLAVVCYEMLSRRHPFNGTGYEDVAQAILRYTPPPISEFNSLVSPAISQVIHKALAKEPFLRFTDIRKFSDCLQKALRGEPIDIFDAARIVPRLQQARKAFDSGDLDDAAEIVMELESENYLAPDIGKLRKEIDEQRRTKTVKQLLETARRRFEEGEYIRALQKVQEILNIDPTNTDAFTLKGAIESRRSATQIEEWFRLASQHMENHAYTHARQALENVRNLQPKEVRAQALLVEVDRREQEHIKLRKEKDQTYQSALDAYQRGDLDSAANKLERFRDLDRRAPHATSPHQGAAYQKLYDEVRSRRDQLAAQEREARRQFDEQNFAEAASICEAVLAIYPNNVVFRALHDDIEQAQRLEVSAYVAKIERQVAAEPDLNSRVSILEEAQKKYPAEQRFEQSLQAVRTRRDTVDLIAGRARTFEEQRQFSDALGQWETLRNIHPKYPGLDIEIDRLNKRREQQSRADAKAHCVTQVDQALAVHNYVKAASLAADGLEEFAGDAELIALQKQVRNAQDRALQAEGKANEGKELTRTGQWKAALDIHREAFQLDAHNPMVRSGLIDALLKEAGRCIDSDWRAAEPLVQEALDLDPNNPLAKSICTLIQDKRQAEEVSEALSKARELQAQGDTKLAFAAVDAIRDRYPREPRLIHYRASLRESLSTKEREELRLRDLEEVNRLARASKETTDVQALESIFQKSHVFSKYGSDAEFREPLSAIQERLRTEQEALKPLALAAAVGGPDAGAETCRRDSAEAPGKQRVPERIAHARWRIVVRDLRPTFIWAGIGFALVALVLIMAVRPQSNHANLFGRTKEVPSKLVSLAIQGAERNEYQIFDTNGADITDGSVAGLSQGKYNLIASRSGFKKFELPFSIDPTKESSKSLVVQWQTLLPELRFSMSRSGGAVMVDDTARTLDAKGALTEQWSNGSHKILWTNADGDYAEVHFEVSDAEIIVPSPVFHGYVVGIAAVLKNGELTYQTVNSSGGVSTVVDGQSASRPSAGRFSVPSAQIVSFKVRPGEYPLGDYQVDPAGPPAIYVYIASQARPAKGSKPAPPIDIPKEIGPGEISGSPRTPVVPTEEEQRRQKEEAARRKLDEVKKLEEDKQKLRDALLGREKASKTVKQ